MGKIDQGYAANKNGTAAEYLVCADLLLKGYNAVLSNQHEPYDIVVDIDDRFLRIQVKSMPNERDHSTKRGYHFDIRGKVAGSKNKRIKSTGDKVDYYALVALDIQKIAYIPKADLLKDGLIQGQVTFGFGERQRNFEDYRDICVDTLINTSLQSGQPEKSSTTSETTILS